MSTPSHTILITGAAGGIGRHAALHLARRGHHVLASGRNLEALKALKAEAAGLRLEVLALDVTDAASIAGAVEAVDRLTEGRGVDDLVNNAGYGLAGALEEIGDEELRAQFDTNVFGLMAVTRAFLPRLRARGAGRIVNISSMAGRVTFPFFGAYHASKYALEALSDALRMEMAGFGVRVVLIEPGPIRSNFSGRAMQEVSRYRGNAASPYAPCYERAEWVQRMMDARAAHPDTVARAIARAIERRRPAARYVVPFTNRFTLCALRALPTRLSDAIMRLVVGLTRKRLARGSDLARLSA